MKKKPCEFTLGLITSSLIILLLLVGGCGKADVKGTQADEGLPTEAVAVRKAFESAAPGHKHPVAEVLNLVKAGAVNRDAYVEALPKLQMLAVNPTITDEQKKSLEALVEKLKGDLNSRKIR